ncbi:hypothetical protein P5G51_019660 [Virgibacillus sp. 179-BFC.A HS]|uniref:Uncharacterized protein n=1 Tax=Tigheibacillus jepli TaxID=3035914 RepID=A0ABU5CLP0_9BACI|nr:hypothetical protein [Virgibacillus sp. 179-BFC.A HS]MDY0407251.1 hypothetical protein [Virgibacillus sp. 179-BFC.A HS]
MEEELHELIRALEEMSERQSDYHAQALLFATSKLLQEQDKRIALMEGELDGTLWSPRNWGE